LRLRLLAIDILRELKSMYTYRDLSSVLGIQESLICRYVNGVTIPSELQAMEIIDKIKSKGFIMEFFKNKIKMYSDGYVDTSWLLQFPSILKILMENYLEEFKSKVSKIVTIASNGIPFATIATMILNVPLVIVRKYKESIELEYIEENVMEGKGYISNLYLRKDLLDKGDKVLIVDDVIRTGKTIFSLSNLIKRRNAEVYGVFVIVAVGNEWSKVINSPIKYIFKI